MFGFSALMGLIYTALSKLMLFWHWVWDSIGVGEFLATNWNWVLAIVFMVLTVRGVLFPVFVKQIKSQRAMQALQPKIKELQEKHKGDKQALQQAQMELMRREKANPLMGCLPMLVQWPIFVGVFHLLRHLKPSMPPELQTLYGWTQAQFYSASHAKLFGVGISSTIKDNPTVSSVIVTGILVLIMVASTYMTSKQMINKTGWATDPTQLMMQRLMLYFLPLTLIFSGVFFPLGAVIYYVISNLFSLGQQFYVLRKFPPPAMPGAKPGGPKPAAANGKAALNGKAVTNSKVVTTRKGAKDDATNGTPVAPVAAGPKVGAKPVNKKGGAAKRQPSS
jgi:YidC/Oxa1 family membrane protein insertase